MQQGGAMRKATSRRFAHQRHGESMPNTRIFWTTQEKDTVLSTARKLREQHPRLTLKQLGSRAQAPLPKARRRPVNNKLTSWLSAAFKGATPPTTRGPRAAKVGKRARAGTTAAPRATRAAEAPNVLQTLIEHGATILSGMLRHPSVREAVGSTFGRGTASRKR